MSTENIPSIASLLKHGCQVTHFRNTRGWIETPDGRFFKPEPNKVRFIKEMNRPFIYTQKINKGIAAALINALKKSCSQRGHYVYRRENIVGT